MDGCRAIQHRQPPYVQCHRTDEHLDTYEPASVYEYTTHVHTHAMCVITMHFSSPSTPYTIKCTRTTHTHILRHVQNEFNYPSKADVSSCVFSFVNAPCLTRHFTMTCEVARVKIGVGFVHPSQNVQHMSYILLPVGRNGMRRGRLPIPSSPWRQEYSQ